DKQCVLYIGQGCAHDLRLCNPLMDRRSGKKMICSFLGIAPTNVTSVTIRSLPIESRDCSYLTH
ncbi:MAG: hypothetical protein WBF33_20465, partial [Candidatus Nitrosopolaris sp.]